MQRKEYSMYRRLEAELILNGIQKKELALRIRMPYTTLSDKLRNRTAFTLDEAQAIKDAIKTDLSIETLFEFTINEQES
jgi:hypothetical protein